MNWKHDLIRLWALTSILWLLVVSYLASGVFFKPLPFQGDYQYVVQTKEMPWNIDWNKPYYETCYAPGKGRFPDKFTTVDDEQYIQQFDEGRKAGKLALIEFPDNSRLYMPEELTETDKNYLAKLFFEQRWYRYVWKISSWLVSAFGLPLLVLIFGFAIAWVSGGFKKPAI
ncbi:MAG: hypothetical protein M3Z96_00275 [Pseudomonadota bacterium]|nr:hypothetical protein [Pseudomonadota bacterium]